MNSQQNDSPLRPYLVTHKATVRAYLSEAMHHALGTLTKYRLPVCNTARTACGQRNFDPVLAFDCLLHPLPPAIEGPIWKHER